MKTKKPAGHTSKYLDVSTGELLAIEKEYTIVYESEPSFIKLYLSDIGRLHKMQSRTMAVLLELLKTVDYENMISVPLGLKQKICERIGIFKEDKDGEQIPNANVFNQHIAKLVEAKLIFKKSAGTYMANPLLFGKGKWSDIRKIRFVIEYGEKGRAAIGKIDKPEPKK